MKIKLEITIIIGLILTMVLGIVGYSNYKSHTKALDEIIGTMYVLGRQDQLSIDRIEFSNYQLQVNNYLKNYAENISTSTNK